MYSFLQAFDPTLILICFLGSGLGIIWAAMPGLSTTMAMALLVGLTYGMPTDVAVAFILGTFTGSVFGGAVSAILMNIPGTPDAVPTQMAGFPLAKKGQGGLALGMAITSSMIGNWAGILMLAALSPLAISIALNFASWEVALLALWGVSISGTLTSGERAIKGWICGWVGLIIGLVGREEIHGVARFTFESRELLLGIPYIPVLIGLFGVAEVIVALSETTPYAIPQKVGRVFPPIRKVLKYWKSIIRSSVIGLCTGIIPGAGANVATFVSYGVGEQITKRKFSDGDLEGVVCSEVANNANIGGAMLPSLVLGIPGSAPTAAFLAALSLHGIVVGPMIAHEQPGFLGFIYGCLIVANIGMYMCAFVLIKPSVKVFSLPREVLLPIVLLFCVVGAFAEKMAMFDVYLMLGFGILGFIMRKTGFPVGPMVLGVILANMFDNNLRRGALLMEGEPLMDVLMGRPVAMGLIVLVVATFVQGIMPRRSKKTEDLTSDLDTE